MSDDTPSREGELLAGKYRLQRRLGVGGMGEVYRARNEFVGRDVAIKVLRPELCRHVEVVQRFLREARAANSVRHDNVVDVIDMGTDDRNVPFIVQELLVGHDLAHHLVSRGNRLPVDEILSLMIPVVDAIGAAHQHGVVHRDLKPENVFLTAGKQGVVPKVLDFGISKIVEPGEQKLTATGTAMGTPTYMSPEQVQGSSDLDARADVWALGVMLYELASGVLPFHGPSAGAIFVAICTRDAAPLGEHVRDISPDYARIVERCLRRDLAARYPTAASLLRDLRHLQRREAIEATGAVSLVPPGEAEAAIERLSAEARAHAGGTMVGGQTGEARGLTGAIASPTGSRPARVEETMPPVVRSPAPARRAALFVGSTAALVASVGVGAILLSGRHPPADRPSAAVTSPARPVAEPVHALLAPRPAPPPLPVAVAIPSAHPDAGAAVPPAVAPPPAAPVAAAGPTGRRGHGRRRPDAAPAPAPAVTVPVIGAAPRAAPTPAGVGTTEYE